MTEKEKKLEELIGQVRYFTYHDPNKEIYLDGNFLPQELIEIAKIVGDYGP